MNLRFAILTIMLVLLLVGCLDSADNSLDSKEKLGSAISVFEGRYGMPYIDNSAIFMIYRTGGSHGTVSYKLFLYNGTVLDIATGMFGDCTGRWEVWESKFYDSYIINLTNTSRMWPISVRQLNQTGFTGYSTWYIYTNSGMISGHSGVWQGRYAVRSGEWNISNSNCLALKRNIVNFVRPS